MPKIYKMKKVVLFLCLVSLNIFSQTVNDKIAQETCDCLSKVDLESTNADDLDLNIGLCMLESYNNHISEFAENEKLDFEDEVQMEKYGEQIAMKMLAFCPNIILKLGSIDNANEDESESLFIDGNFNGTSNKESFFTVLIKENNGKISKLALLDNFDNSYLIIDKVLKINDSVSVNYYEIELFDVKLNRFVTTKIITDITKK